MPINVSWMAVDHVPVHAIKIVLHMLERTINEIITSKIQVKWYWIVITSTEGLTLVHITAYRTYNMEPRTRQRQNVNQTYNPGWLVFRWSHSC